MGRSLVAEKIENYVNGVTRETGVQKALHRETLKLKNSGMQIGPDQAAFFTMLMKLLNAKKAIEIGTFTGYSALAIACGLPEDGKLIACDISEEWTDIGRPFWEKAGVAGKIDLRIGTALETLKKLLKDGEAETFDFVFIDADKNAYPDYYEAALKLLRQGGVVALDNMLWSGEVAESGGDSQTRTLRELNAKIRDDERVEECLLTLGDGVMLAMKK